MHNPTHCPTCGAPIIRELSMRGTLYVDDSEDCRYDATYACGAARYVSYVSEYASDVPGPALYTGWWLPCEGARPVKPGPQG